LDDHQSTEVYISSRDGSAVQMTTGHVRFWNWLGAVPHWIYFPYLRTRPAAWTQTVIWTSTLGCFLTLTGLVAGIVQIRRVPNGRWVPYRGFHYWHHVLGLIFGVFVLTWVASGLISVNPWGFLEGDGFEEPARLHGAPVQAAAVADAIRSLPGTMGTDIVSIESAPLNSSLFLVATRADGQRLRLDAKGTRRPLSRSDLNFIAAALDPQIGRFLVELIDREDMYYFSYHRNRADLPSYRAVIPGSTGSRYYLDPVSGQLRAKFDRDGQRYRWLHQAVHRLDFNATVRSRPWWHLMTLSLLAGVTATCAFGAYLGIRSLKR
jgi:hypothetical protein